MAPAIILPRGVNLEGLDRTPTPPRIFDSSPERNRGVHGIANHCSTREWDNRFIACLVDLGCDRQIAEQVRVHPPARLSAAMAWSIAQDAAEGDVRAKAALDRIRHAFAHASGVGEALDGREQPSNPGELQSLMGLD
jgi:hypothetical protein